MSRPVAALSGVALVEALKIILELGVSGFDELAQRGSREVAILVVDRLDPGAVDRQQFPAEQVELPAQQHEFSEYRPERGAVVAAEIGDRLEVVGFRCRSSQITSMLRWVSASKMPA